ncbi:MAG: colicin V production protein [Bacteroidetes bacterium OLB11]|nr:MAG: colicin V production protein [Bacteroidetes bacterium OLB11]
MGWVNNALGAVLYMFIISFVMSSFLWVFNATHLVQIFNFTNSKTFPFLEPIAPKTFEIFTPYIPFLKEVYSNFETILNK